MQNVRNIRGEKEPVQDIITYHLLRMVMEPKYLAEEVIVHLNQPLTRWLDHYDMNPRLSDKTSLHLDPFKGIDGIDTKNLFIATHLEVL